MVQCLLNHIEPIGLAHIHRALGNFHISRNLEIATFLGWWAHQPTIFGGLVVRSFVFSRGIGRFAIFNCGRAALCCSCCSGRVVERQWRSLSPQSAKVQIGHIVLLPYMCVCVYTYIYICICICILYNVYIRSHKERKKYNKEASLCNQLPGWSSQIGMETSRNATTSNIPTKAKALTCWSDCSCIAPRAKVCKERLMPKESLSVDQLSSFHQQPSHHTQSQFQGEIPGKSHEMEDFTVTSHQPDHNMNVLIRGPSKSL